jgi:hypothetical protein
MWEVLKLLEEIIGKTLKDTGTGDDFPELLDSSKKWLLGLNQMKNFLHSKSNNYQSEEAACRVGENFCQIYIWQGTNIQYT